MRLIDADAMIASLKEYIDKPMTAGLCATLIEMFPTAYNIEKVVEIVRVDCYSMGFDESQAEIIVEDIRKGGIKE